MDPQVADTIETLTERLQTSTLLEDRCDSVRAIRSLAKAYRVEICAQSLEALINAIKTDRNQAELVNYCLETINYIISGSLADSPAATWPNSDQIGDGDHDPGQELAEIFLKHRDNINTLLETLTDNDFKSCWTSLKILCGLARHTLPKFQDSILNCPTSISRLVQLLANDQEIIRNDALMLFTRLTQSNTDVQNLAVYENCYEKIMYIISMEDYLKGTLAVIMDCLNIIVNTLSNEQNQVLFRDGGNIQKLTQFFRGLPSSVSIDWTPDLIACLMLVLRIVDLMLNPTNSPVHVQACQDIMQRCGLLDSLLVLLEAPHLPIGILCESMNTVSDILRGNLEQNSNIIVKTSIMPVLLLSMVKEICGNRR